MRALSIALSVLAAGCVLQPVDFGSNPPPSPDESTARRIYDHEVVPLLTSMCTTCHSAGSSFGELTYDSILADAFQTGMYQPSAAQILTKGVHEGPQWTVEQAATIDRWLEAEQTARDH